MASLARWCFRRRFVVIGLWVALLVALGAASQAVGDRYTDSFSLPGTESTRALELLQKAFPSQSGDSDTIVWHAKRGSVRDPAVRPRIERMLERVDRVDHVAGVDSPYSRQGAAQISRDGRTAYATIRFDALADKIPKDDYLEVIDIAESARGDGVQVELG